MHPSAVLHMARGKGKTVPIKVRRFKICFINLFFSLFVTHVNFLCSALELCRDWLLLHNPTKRLTNTWKVQVCQVRSNC